MAGFIKEFKEFAIKGNMIDLAVGIIIGSAFGKLVTSLVNDVIMPVIGQFIGGISFDNLFITLDGREFASLKAAEEAGASVLKYGVFISTIVDFIIIAFVIFLVVKAINSMKRSKPEPKPEPKGPSEIDLLTEIRDSLKK